MRYFDDINAWAVDFPDKAQELQKGAHVVLGQVAMLACRKNGELYRINADLIQSTIDWLYRFFQIPPQEEPYIILSIDPSITHRNKTVFTDGMADEFDFQGSHFNQFLSLLEYQYMSGYSGTAFDVDRNSFVASSDLFRRAGQFSYIRAEYS